LVFIIKNTHKHYHNVKQILLLLACCAATLLNAQVISIAEARALPAGSTVTVRGVVTNGAELGRIRYMQDGTAGIGAFPGTGSVQGFDTAVKLGDSIEVTGQLLVFNGLLEISPISAYQILASNVTLPQPKTIAISDLSDNYEGQLIRFECVNFENGGGQFTTQGVYNVLDVNGQVGKVFIRSNHPLLGTAIPAGTINLTCILSDFNGFQLLPRTAADFSANPCFYFTQSLEQSDIQTTGFKLSWTANQSGNHFIRWNSTPDLSSATTLSAGSGAGISNFPITGLEAGRIYWAQAIAVHNNDTISTEVRPFATRSLSSGEVKIYFTHPVDPSFVGSLAPSGQNPQACVAAIIERIDAAEQTIDVAMYNNDQPGITNALEAARARGVRIRYVAAVNGGSPALMPPPSFPVIYGNEFNLMHNKFMVIDVNLTNKAWVMGGSLNWSTANIFDDYNNLIFVQDQSLARAYTLEIDEMWGGTGDQPNAALAKFGSSKRDNTPHQFIIGGAPVEQYFSPTDGVTQRIAQTISTADDEALFALLTFTRDEPADALVAEVAAGTQVRGLIENTTDQGAEFQKLVDGGVNVQRHTESFTLHHKYVVVDAMTPASNPSVLSGSHNWSSSAENSNDENTLVFHSEAIARLFKAEFERRWVENTTPTLEAEALEALRLSPNPAQNYLLLHEAPAGELRVLDLLGRVWLRQAWNGEGTARIETAALPAGAYRVQVLTDNGLRSLPFQKI